MSEILGLKKSWKFWLPKKGHSADEYEDASAADLGRMRFALADGASESSYAAAWARLLVDEFVQADATPRGSLAGWLPSLQERWARQVGQGPFPWYTETKVQEGAFATFLGLAFESSGLWWWKRLRWHAVAVGDGCLFQVRQGQLIQRFPLQRSDEFHNSPWLVSSRPGQNQTGRPEQHASGICLPDDCFWLMTDALAGWFLRQVEMDKKPWQDLEAVGMANDPEQAFAAWVEKQRQDRELRNDDVTLLMVCL